MAMMESTPALILSRHLVSLVRSTRHPLPARATSRADAMRTAVRQVCRFGFAHGSKLRWKCRVDGVLVHDVAGALVGGEVEGRQWRTG